MKKCFFSLFLMCLTFSLLGHEQVVAQSDRAIVLGTVEQSGSISASIKTLVRSAMISTIGEFEKIEAVDMDVSRVLSVYYDRYGMMTKTEISQIATMTGAKLIIIPEIAELDNTRLLVTARTIDAVTGIVGIASTKATLNMADDIQRACHEAMVDVLTGREQEGSPAYTQRMAEKKAKTKPAPSSAPTNRPTESKEQKTPTPALASTSQQYSKQSNNSDVDINIPKKTSTTDNKNTFVLIISNENYKELAKVSYALRDGDIFYKYCTQTLGIPKNHIRFYKDATYGDMLSAIDKVNNIAKAYKTEGINLIVYYAGHGAPNDATKEAYLIPVDAFNVNTRGCYALKDFYADLAAMQAQRTMVFLDACFSGSARAGGGEMLASARGVAISSKTETLNGNMVVFTATNGSETALPYEEQKHGLFTYFLLKKLQETKGEVSMGDLTKYIKSKVMQQSVVTNDKAQTPTVNFSANAVGWENWRLDQ